MLGSGPSGGVVGACNVAQAAGIEDFISVDMGGTSYDVCLVRGGRPQITSSWNWHHRYLVGLPMVDVQSVGAGGGSIARRRRGALHVGPGERRRPARTDLLPPRRLASHRHRREPRARLPQPGLLLRWRAVARPRRRAARDRRADPPSARSRQRGGRTASSAWSMQTWRTRSGAWSATRGVDPRELPLVAFGGNGAVHAGMQARELDQAGARAEDRADLLRARSALDGPWS